MENALKQILEIFKKKDNREFYGDVTIKFQKGKVTKIDINESIKITN